MYDGSWNRGGFVKNFHFNIFNTICNITQEPQELQRFNCVCGSISKFAVIKYHQLLSKVLSIWPVSNSFLPVAAPASKFFWENGGQDPEKFLGFDHFKGQDPTRVIGFDHFVQVNAHFFLISQNVGPFFSDFTESWGGKLGGKTKWGICHPWHRHCFLLYPSLRAVDLNLCAVCYFGQGYQTAPSNHNLCHNFAEILDFLQTSVYCIKKRI